MPDKHISSQFDADLEQSGTDIDSSTVGSRGGTRQGSSR
jgi:hypothetical protein